MPRRSPCSSSCTPPRPRWIWLILVIVPVVYSTSGVTVSTFSRCATAKMRRESLFSAASMARNVVGRPAPTGVETPGNSTTSRSGSTGSVSRSDMGMNSVEGKHTHGSHGLKHRPCRHENTRSEEHTSELQSRLHLVCRLLLEKKKNTTKHQADRPQEIRETVIAISCSPHRRPEA